MVGWGVSSAHQLAFRLHLCQEVVTHTECILKLYLRGEMRFAKTKRIWGRRLERLAHHLLNWKDLHIESVLKNNRFNCYLTCMLLERENWAQSASNWHAEKFFQCFLKSCIQFYMSDQSATWSWCSILSRIASRCLGPLQNGCLIHACLHQGRKFLSSNIGGAISFSPSPHALTSTVVSGSKADKCNVIPKLTNAM